MEDFNGILPRLEKDYRSIGLDSRGHGKSPLGTEPLTYVRLQKDAKAVASHLRVEPAGVIGFNDGGIVAYRLAAKAEVRIQKVVTIGSVLAVDGSRSCPAVFIESNGGTREG